MALPFSHTLSDHYMKIAFYCLGGQHPYLYNLRVYYNTELFFKLCLNAQIQTSSTKHNTMGHTSDSFAQISSSGDWVDKKGNQQGNLSVISQRKNI